MRAPLLTVLLALALGSQALAVTKAKPKPPPPPPERAGCVDRAAAPLRPVVAPYPRGIERVTGEAYIAVNLHADGSIASTGVYRSSNVIEFDDAALRAAQEARYRPGIANCVAYSSGLVVRVGFAGGKAKVEPDTAKCAATDAMLGALARPDRRAKLRGTVSVGLTVEPDGSLQDVELIDGSGNNRLDREALRIAKASTYTPGRADCEPIESSLQLELRFR